MLRKLRTPAKIQGFLNGLAFNFEEDGDTLRSPLMTLRAGRAHCLEGALLGAYLLSRTGHEPLLVHLKAAKPDQDHVVAVFTRGGRWGALSKTNHAVLRYREPVYETLRELVMSYFHEYFLDDGRKTLRSYSEPLHLGAFDPEWVTAASDLWGIDEALDFQAHHSVLPEGFRATRRADPIERQAGKITESGARAGA